MGQGYQPAPDHALEDFRLVFKVQVRRAFGDAGGLGNVFDLGGGIAALDKQRQGGVKDFVGTGSLATLPARGGIVFHANSLEREKCHMVPRRTGMLK